MPEENKDNPTYTNPAYDVMSRQWIVVRAVTGGTPTMREAGETFLPRNPLEGPDSYKKRLKRVSFFNVFRETKMGMAGMVFRKEAKLSDDTPERIAEELKDVDLMGNDVDEFASQIFDEGCTVGQVYGFVDFTINDGVLNLAEERARGLRPYWVKIDAENILSWRTRVENGKVIVEQIVIREFVVEPAGQFLEVVRRQYKVIRENDFDVWRHKVKADGTEDNDELEIIAQGVNTLGEVPLVVFNFNRESTFVSTPPFLDLAYENISHWQSRSDHRNSLHFSSIAVLTIKGRATKDQGKSIEWAADSVLDLPQNAEAVFLETEGRALEATRNELQDSETRMARMGLSFIVEGDPDVKATKLKQDKAEGDSKLSKMVGELKRGMTRMMSFHQKWLTNNSDDMGGEYIPNTDFSDTTLSSEMVDKWIKLVEGNMISLETMWEALKQGEILPDDFENDVELQKLADELSARMKTEAAAFPDNKDDGNNEDEDDDNLNDEEDDDNET